MPYTSLPELIAQAKAGQQIVVLPTDTVPGLAVRPDRGELIFAAKQRSETKPLILLGASAEDLWPFVGGSAEEQALWRSVAERYWPGALTLVLPASDRVPPAINPTDPTTVGLRVPQRAIARHILAQTGPLATTSANLSGQPALQTLEEIAAQFPQVLLPQASEIAAIEGDRPSTSGTPSTVVKWTGTDWEVLRQGAIALPL